jgi:hypothetical protein
MSMLRPLSTLFAVVALAGCATKAPPLEQTVPSLDVSIRHAPGSPLGAVSAPAPAQPLLVDVRCFRVDAIPADFGPRAVVAARLITDADSEPVAVAGSLLERLIIRTDPETLSIGPGADVPGFGSVSQPLQTQLLIVPGGTARVRYDPMQQVGEPSWVEFGFIAADVLGTPTPQLLLRTPEPATASPAEDAVALSLRTRTAVLPWPGGAAAETRFALALPSSPERGFPMSALWLFSVRPLDDDPQQLAELEKIRQSWRGASAAGASGRPQWSAPLRSAVIGADIRRAILFVAGETGADILAEAALLVPDAQLISLAEQALGVLDAATEVTTATQLSWQLDRAAILVLSKSVEQNAASLAATFSARFGEVGLDPATVAELATASGSREDFQTRLQAEHILLLEDTSPAARVRAFDWMKANGVAPADYDPLGSRADRRAAIEKFLNPPTTQAAP